MNWRKLSQCIEGNTTPRKKLVEQNRFVDFILLIYTNILIGRT